MAGRKRRTAADARSVGVLISRPLAIDQDDPSWKALAQIARIRVRSLESRANLSAHPGLKSAAGLITMLSDRVDAAVFDRAPCLKVVANYAVGFNNIDLDAAKARGIVVCNTPDVLTNATAELTIGLILAAARCFHEGTELIRSKKFKGWHPRLLLGREVAGARLGIVGYGRIGRAVAEKAQALGMDIAHCNSNDQLEELLRTSDFVSIHCPLTEQTRGLFGQRQFALMKRGAYLINTARGEIIDEKALLGALGRNLRGAALDVFCGEPRLNPALLKHPRIFVLPHLGSATVEARAGMAHLTLAAVTQVLCGRNPLNRVG